MPINPKMVDVNRIPKEFIDAGLSAHGKEFFFFFLSSGDNIIGFATNPSTFKSLAKMFQTNLEIYEKKYGIIELHDEPIISPIQFDSLGGEKK